MVRTLKLAPWASSATGQKIPIIHNVKVSYEGLDHEKRSARWHEQHDWCKVNCRDKFYGAPGWSPAWGFEDDEDATAFALRWV